MAAPTTLPALLDTLTKSLSSALEAAPKVAGVELSKDGISLLDVKNDLLLSYLQNLVFLILLKLRQSKTGSPALDADETSLDDLVVKKLIELRVYLEKGVRPLEDKLRYQIDKVLRAADDAERSARAAEAAAKGEESDSDSEAESGSEAGEEDKAMDAAPKITDQNYRANLSAWKRPEVPTHVGKSTDANGVYKPPRIAPTVMPTTERREKKERSSKSATLDEFIADEMSAAPVAVPSIGTTIVQGGRRTKSTAERKVEEERKEYEEGNFVRLPMESKKDKAKKAKAEGGKRRMEFGGEEWRDLGQGVDRIHRLTQGKSTGRGTKALLEKSRKRGMDTTDGPKGDGGGGNMGEHYQKRLKVLEGGRRDRGNKKR